MSRPEKELNDTLRFQLSLLNLAVVPHGPPRGNPGTRAASELLKLAEKVQPTSGNRPRSHT